MLRSFAIHEPATVAEASGLLERYGPEAAIYAGGTELLVLMKEGLVHFPQLVNVKTVPGLDQIEHDRAGGALRIGPLATHRAIEHSAIVREQAPLLAEVERQVANVRVRATGTIGGNLCFAEPHSDPATLLVAWGATLELTSASGNREVSAPEFFVGMFETARRHDEILTGIRLPIPQDGVGTAYERFSLHERPTATVAVWLEVEHGVVRDARIVVGSVGPVPVRVPAAERVLRGEWPDDQIIEAAADAAVADLEISEDPLESSDYKRHIARVLTARALNAAVSGATGGRDAG